MSKMDVDEIDEKPLDPEVEKVRRKMVRLLAVSIGIMMIGVMAVLGAIVYRITQQGDESVAAAGSIPSQFQVPADGPLSATANLPQDFTVDHVALDGANILFYGANAQGEAAGYVFNMETGRIIAEIGLSN